MIFGRQLGRWFCRRRIFCFAVAGLMAFLVAGNVAKAGSHVSYNMSFDLPFGAKPGQGSPRLHANLYEFSFIRSVTDAELGAFAVFRFRTRLEDGIDLWGLGVEGARFRPCYMVLLGRNGPHGSWRRIWTSEGASGARVYHLLPDRDYEIYVPMQFDLGGSSEVRVVLGGPRYTVQSEWVSAERLK